MGARVVTSAKVFFPVGLGPSSTGRQPVNRPDDVKAIQQILNDLGPDNDGPDTPLAVTGFIDGPTVDAIRNFQQKQFGWQDGVVDPRQMTLRQMNKLNNTPLDPLNQVLPEPPLVEQSNLHHCWAASLESWLDVTNGREQVDQDQLVKDFKATEDSNGALTGAGWSAVSKRFNIAGTRFAIQGTPLAPNELNGEYLAERLKTVGFLLFVYNLYPGGPSHVNVVYGCYEMNDKTYLKVMDPFTQGNGGLVDRPLSFYSQRSAVDVLFAPAQ
jgi:peptidoglycan hydrolase-like protein with peptidoglycan-binding domain